MGDSYERLWLSDECLVSREVLVRACVRAKRRLVLISAVGFREFGG